VLCAPAGPGLADTEPRPASGDRSGGAKSVPEILPGILQGYLHEEEQLDSRKFVPPAPAAESLRQQLDDAWAWRMLRLRDTPRWQLATTDAELAFPEAASVFSCELGFSVSEARTPSLYLLLRRSLTDLGLSTYAAKNAYQRKRPFMTTNTPVCTPGEKAKLQKDGSYPSGHTAIGWGWALILAELMPDRAERILSRGIVFGESRNVCNVHWASDVEAGRLVGAATVARLHGDPEFQADLRAARQEMERIRVQPQQEPGPCQANRTELLGDEP
jgi:acid phosphatase (class A)